MAPAISGLPPRSGTTSWGAIPRLPRTVSIFAMGTTTFGMRGRRRATRFRPERWGARRPSRRPSKSVPKLRAARIRRARRRRFLVRRVAFVLTLLALALVILSLGVPAPGIFSSRAAYIQPITSVEGGTLPELPDPSPPELGQVWADAGDRSPDLATSGKLTTSGGKIALTFDDGPDPRVTPSILDTLREHHIEATFFVVGRQVEKHPGLLRRIVDEGHTIGNHTYDHADMSHLSPEQMRSELQDTQKAVDKALGYHYQMALMRPPYGDPYFGGSDALPAFRRVMSQQQLLPVTWTIDSQDYLMDGYPEGIVRNVIRQDEAGRRQDRDEVVLMHDIHPQDVQALPEIVDHYDGSGRKFVGVDELLRDKYLGH